MENQTTTPGRSLTFATFDLPTSVTTPNGTYTMTYDPELHRFGRTDPSGKARYSYGGLFDVHTEADGDHYVTTLRVGHPVAEIESVVSNGVVARETTTALLTDPLGSIDALVDASGAATPVKYDPFGGRVQTTDPFVSLSAPPNGVRAGFAGHDNDDDVGLVDMLGRVYDPRQQRFLTKDPPAPDATESQAWNPYSYVRNNPLKATDPTGFIEVLMSGSYLSSTGDDSGLLGMGYQYGYTVLHSGFDEHQTISVVVQGSSGRDGPGVASLVPGIMVAGDNISGLLDGTADDDGVDFVQGVDGRDVAVSDLSAAQDKTVDELLAGFTRGVPPQGGAPWITFEERKSVAAWNAARVLLQQIIEQRLGEGPPASMGYPSPFSTTMSPMDRMQADFDLIRNAGLGGTIIMLGADLGMMSVDEALDRIEIISPWDSMIGARQYSYSSVDRNVESATLRTSWFNDKQLWSDPDWHIPMGIWARPGGH